MALNFYYYPGGDKKQASNLDHPNTTDPLDAGKYHPLVNWLAFTMMACGIRAITAQNVDEVLRRFTVHQRIFGPAMKYGNGDVAYFVREDVERYVGFEVNVSDINKTEFNARVVRWCASDIYKAASNARQLPAFELYAQRAGELKEPRT